MSSKIYEWKIRTIQYWPDGQERRSQSPSKIFPTNLKVWKQAWEAILDFIIYGLPRKVNLRMYKFFEGQMDQQTYKPF